jgi:hypothetical protein
MATNESWTHPTSDGPTGGHLCCSNHFYQSAVMMKTVRWISAFSLRRWACEVLELFKALSAILRWAQLCEAMKDYPEAAQFTEATL